MPAPPDDLAKWLAEARRGCPEALGKLLEAYRRYLLLIAERELPADLRSKGGASDLVQQNFLEAHQGFAGFAGRTPQEFRGWLRRNLLHNIANFTRRYRDTAKRCVAGEQPLAPADSQGVGGDPQASTLTPSGKAMAREQAEAMQRALGRLPEDYRFALVLRFQERLSFEEIGEAL
jgi:RNA polymerase sigma-70 factor (ECF subfamily)